MDIPKSLVGKEMDAVRAGIAAALSGEDCGLISDVAKHIIESGGKGVRPLIVLLVAGACGGIRPEHIRLATVIELIHTATILHDDVVDATIKRRNQETANSAWGNDVSVLMGDFVYSRALNILLKLQQATVTQSIIHACEQLSIGELRQMTQRQHLDTDEAMYFEIIKHKTAILFEVSAYCSVLFCEHQAYADTVRLYGTHIGIAFQLRDDLLDYIGDSKKTGKNLGTDLMEGNITLPVVYALKHADKKGQTLLRDSIQSKDASRLKEVVSVLESSGGIAYTQKRAGEHTSKAMDALNALPNSQFKEMLCQLLSIITERQA